MNLNLISNLNKFTNDGNSNFLNSYRSTVGCRVRGEVWKSLPATLRSNGRCYKVSSVFSHKIFSFFHLSALTMTLKTCELILRSVT